MQLMSPRIRAGVFVGTAVGLLALILVLPAPLNHLLFFAVLLGAPLVALVWHIRVTPGGKLPLETASGGLGLMLVGLLVVLPSPLSDALFFAVLVGVPSAVLVLLLAKRASRLHPSHTPGVLGAAALACMAGGAFALRADPVFPSDPLSGALTFGAGALLLGAALWTSSAPEEKQAFVPVAALPSAPHLRWLSVQRAALICGGLLALVLLTAANIGVFILHVNAQFGLLGVGCGLMVAGLARGDVPLSPAARARLRLTAADAVLLFTLVFAAFLLRALALDTTIRTLIDELHFMGGINWLRADPTKALLSPMTGLSPFTWLYPYLQTGLVEIFGRTLTGFRIVSAFIGAANVAALYGLVRATAGRRAALLAALMLAVFPPHIHFSRAALIQIADPLVLTMTLMFLARGRVTGRRLDYALAGVCLGFSQYFYEAGRLLIPVLTLVWLVGMWVFDRLPRIRWGHLLALMLPAAALALPVLLVYTLLHVPYAERLNVSGVGPSMMARLLTAIVERRDVEFFIPQLLYPFYFLVAMREPEAARSWGAALLLPVMVPLFLLGIAAALYHLVRRDERAPGMLAALLWLAGLLLGNAFLRDMMNSPRYVIGMPALAWLLAAGLGAIVPLLRWNASRPARWTALLLWGTALLLGGVQVRSYFTDLLNDYQVLARPGRDYHDAVLRAVELPSNTQVFVVEDPPWDGDYLQTMVLYFRDDLRISSLTSAALSDDLLSHLPTATTYAFFVPVGADQVIARMRRWFVLDTLQISPYPIPPEKQYAMYLARPERQTRR